MKNGRDEPGCRLAEAEGKGNATQWGPAGSPGGDGRCGALTLASSGWVGLLPAAAVGRRRRRRGGGVSRGMEWESVEVGGGRGGGWACLFPVLAVALAFWFRVAGFFFNCLFAFWSFVEAVILDFVQRA